MRLLNENVSVYIKSFKDSITEKCVNKKLKEKYYELKKTIYSDLNKENLNTKETNLVKQKCMNDILNFCKDNKNEIVYPKNK